MREVNEPEWYKINFTRDIQGLENDDARKRLIK